MSIQSPHAHILSVLVHNSLISAGQLCDNGCNVIFTREHVEVTKDGQCVMPGLRDPQSRLWRVNLKKDTKQVYKAECNHAHENSNQKELINYLHAACFSPVKSTWIKAINNEIFTSWPELMEQLVEKHVSKSTSTVKVKVHIHQQRMHARSNQIKRGRLLK
jgi:hypothetical protein